MTYMIDELNKWGCDTAGAMERMDDDEEFYAECLQDIVEDSQFNILKAALAAGDIYGASDAAHTLKGILANVGLTPMYDMVEELLKPLRMGNTDNLTDDFEKLEKMRVHLQGILNTHKE